MRRRLLATAVLGLSFVLASNAHALSYTIAAIHDGLQETPPVVTTGVGALTGTYDDVTNLLTWSGTFSLLIGTTTDAHFHGPAAIGVGPAPVTVHTTAASGDIFPIGVSSGAFSGTATITDLHEADLLAGLWYHNIHTTFAPGGEIRGQVTAVPVPEPTALALVGLGLGGFALASRRRRISR